MAKVADFGLSVTMDETQTHVSAMQQGTLTHMAPETLTGSRQGMASDV